MDDASGDWTVLYWAFGFWVLVFAIAVAGLVALLRARSATGRWTPSTVDALDDADVTHEGYRSWDLLSVSPRGERRTS